ncbi:MAG: hypothetical protein GX614_08340 [Sandaracinaceae bacterium]|nr:hypothetical protein [Sandaracinaceae bacterium]
MGVSSRFILEQRRVIGALLRTGIEASTDKPNKGPAPQTPGPILKETVTPPSPDLIAAYVRHVGGDPAGYRGTIPPHLFPQWIFPMQTATLRGLPYPMHKVLNGGFRMVRKANLPQGEMLQIEGRLANIDEDDRRVIFFCDSVTGTASAPGALEVSMQAIIPKRGGEKKSGPKKSGPRVPEGARELARWSLRADAGRDFAKLTGDINPIHWIPPAARASGFRNVILHGFSTSARAYEGLIRNVFSGNTEAIRAFECRFTKPLVLPARVGLYRSGDEVFVGEAPGGPAYLVGKFETQ